MVVERPDHSRIVAERGRGFVIIATCFAVAPRRSPGQALTSGVQQAISDEAMRQIAPRNAEVQVNTQNADFDCQS